MSTTGKRRAARLVSSGHVTALTRGGAVAVAEAYRKLSELLRRAHSLPGGRLPGERELATRAWGSAGRRCARRWTCSRKGPAGPLAHSAAGSSAARGRRAAEHAAELLRDGQGARAQRPARRVLERAGAPGHLRRGRRLGSRPRRACWNCPGCARLDGVPVCVDVSVVVLARVPLLASADLTDRSLYETMERAAEVRIARSSYTVRADACGRADRGAAADRAWRARPDRRGAHLHRGRRRRSWRAG